MSRRRSAIAVATSLVAAGVIPLTLAMATAASACPGLTDPKGDAPVSPLTVSGNSVGLPNDPDLDFTNLAFVTTPTTITAVLKVDKLGDAATNGVGHQFDFGFTTPANKVFLFYTSKYTAPFDSAREGLTTAGVLVPTTGGRVGGTVNASLVVTSKFDKTTSTVSISVTRASLDTVNGAPVADGSVLKAVAAHSIYPTITGAIPADTAQATAVADQTLTVSSALCDIAFGGGAPTPTGSSTGTPAPTDSPSPSPTGTAPATPVSKLVNAGAVSSQYGDVASVAAKLTNASGAALVGKTVTFKLAGKTGSAKTNSAGVAAVKLALASNASAQTLVASFAGDSSAKASSVSTKFTITTEKTKIAMAVAKSGTARTVTATLLEDDNRALASQKLVVYVNGVKKTTLTTDAKGKVVYKAAKAGQTVKFAFAAVSGKWAASSVQQKLS